MTASKKKKRLDAAGDLALVYEQYTPELKGYIARRTSSAEEAEDILQDVFYKLAKIDLLENPIEYLSAWLYQAATNRIIDRRRKKTEQALPEIRDDDEDEYFLGSLSVFLADENDNPEVMFRNEIIRDELDKALAGLPPEQRSVFELTEYDGLSYKEISESTGVPVPTLLSRKHYAVNRLRECLHSLYQEVITG
ncbi:sigma-70 family RNA polymerase sigma factor [uncultured Alistipes sp.]|jgi:RNA polymerase sigma factor, sigma-70 family|uniref:RNA polymerase sigma factor n=1 Tax=uncultured Alistipes sp. TaxID=538949 RepID=UPI0025E53A25|nr:sigma-70 family RNA polymerase sigma factor [uncultured Alistipes sp.]